MPIQELFDNNRAWSERVTQEKPDFFNELAKQQSPDYLWIGCSDSRVPANQITGLLPGEVFVHRNIANQVPLGDNNCLSVVQYAVQALKVTDIIVCGHYGCGGVEAALNKVELGPVENWLGDLSCVADEHHEAIHACAGKTEQINKLCELNVQKQVDNLAQTEVVQQAWKNGQELRIHGWIYSLQDGLLKNLEVTRAS